MTYIIKEIPLMQRPRERLIKLGAGALSDEELIAILIRTGYKNTNAKDLALELLVKIEDIHHLKAMTTNSLSKIKGIGQVKATTIIAAIELGNRVNKVVLQSKQDVCNPQVIFNLYHEQMNENKQEKLMAILLDTKKQIIAAKIIFIGTINSSIVHPREIFKEAIINSAVNIILVHNHPSGDSKPSIVDDNFTKAIIAAGLLIGINLLDHIIIGNNEYYSYFETNPKLFAKSQ